MKNRRVIFIAIIVAAVVLGVGAGFALYPGSREDVVNVSPAASPVIEYERKDDLIVVDSPKPGERIASPLTVRGRARGNWYFEATFPLVLADWDGRIIAEHYATAEGEWMTTDFVPFSGTLTFTKPEYGEPRTNPSGILWGERGFLILRKDNPSGLPEHDDAIEVPIFFE